jgi:hypothetical protein
MSYEYPEFFDKVEESEKLVHNMIRCNVDSVAYLTQMILPGLLIIFISTINKHNSLILYRYVTKTSRSYC